MINQIKDETSSAQKLTLTAKLETTNQDGEPVAFGLHPDLTGHFSGLVVTHPDVAEEPIYTKKWEDFIKDYPEFSQLIPPPTFHEWNAG